MSFQAIRNGLLKRKGLADVLKLSAVEIALRPLLIARSFVVAKYIGPETYGILKSVELISMLNKFGSLGFKPAIIRNGTTAIAENDKEELISIKNNAYTGELLLSFILMLIGVLSSVFFENKIIIVAIILASIGLFTAKLMGIFSTELQLHKKFGLLSRVILYQGLISSVIVIVTVPLFNIYAVLTVPILSATIVSFVAFKYTGVFFSIKIDKEGFKKILKVSIPLTLGTLAFGLFRYVERIIIITYLGLTNTGYFGFADTITGIIITLLIGSVLKVRGIKIYEELGKRNYNDTHKMIVRETSILIGLSFIVIICIAIGMKLLIPVLLPKWEGAIIATILYSLIIPIKLSSSYVSFVVKSPLINKLKFEPIMHLIATVIMIFGAFMLYKLEQLSLENFILLIILVLLIFHITYILFYYGLFYLPFIYRRIKIEKTNYKT